MSNKHFGENDLPLIEQVKNYYKLRGLSFPDFSSAMKFMETEKAEVYELDLARIGGWIRNNPQNKPIYSKERMAEELGDAIMMLIVAGIAEEVDPVRALQEKMARKIKEAIAASSTKKAATFTTKVELYEDRD